MSCKKKITIAIDGYSSSGKSTMARTLATQLGYRYIDSGAMYRATTLFAIKHDMILPDGRVDVPALTAALRDIQIDFVPMPDGSQHTLLNNIDVEDQIRGLSVSEHVSEVAAIPAVRHILTEKQKSFGINGGIVMDGRDIGTTVFPDAQLKIFVNAAPEKRAMRRHRELIAKGQPADYNEILQNIKHRDLIDTTRDESPLRKADDAILLDNSEMAIEQQEKWLFDVASQTINRESNE